MIPAVTKLIIKVEQLEWDLAEVKAVVLSLRNGRDDEDKFFV